MKKDSGKTSNFRFILLLLMLLLLLGGVGFVLVKYKKSKPEMPSPLAATPIHFEFYTALPRMRINPVFDAAKLENALADEIKKSEKK